MIIPGSKRDRNMLSTNCDYCGHPLRITFTEAKRTSYSFCNDACKNEWKWMQHFRTKSKNNWNCVTLTDASQIPALITQDENGCWLWLDATDKGGYGRARRPDGSVTGAHRIVYELLNGPIPASKHLDHLCCVRRCVNPDHLEPVTQQENTRRMQRRRRDRKN